MKPKERYSNDERLDHIQKRRGNDEGHQER